MLFKNMHLQGIKSGKISLAFRKWKKLSVKEGGLIKTAIGLIEIVDIKIVEENKISEEDALNAGFKNLEQLLSILKQTDTGDIYKITVRYYSEDPRIELRQQTELTEEAFISLKNSLERLDRYRKQGNWTKNVLTAIAENPGKRARDIAELTGKEKEWLKLNIRKLKNLGLTISLDTGYEVSPLGRVFLENLVDNGGNSL